MRKVIIGILAGVGILSVLAVGAMLGLGMLSLLVGESLPGTMVLEVDFQQGLVESVPEDALARVMMGDLYEVLDVVNALDRAAGDRRVRGVFARIGGQGMGLAHIQELRDAVLRFRESGKPAIVFAETFGEFGPGNGGYYLATAFDRIYLQPSGDVGMTGLIYESQFIRGLLDKLEVVPELDQRHEFKNAMNYYTETGYTEPHRRAMQELMDSQFRQLVRGIAEARGLDEDQVYGLFDEGPFLANDALGVGLVDELVYRDEALQALRDDVGDRSSMIDVENYLRVAGSPHRRGETIALIQAHGTITRGSSTYSPVDGSVTIGSDTVTQAFRSAIDDSRVRAIIFRVDSPGGSFVASDTIWRETIRARDAGIPVIVSMGNLAGSGGYFVAMDADKIVAQPGTITASIGVLGGKLVTRKLWEKIGVQWDDVHSSENSRMWSTTYGYGPSYERFQAMLDRIYQVFTEKVAEGRGLPLEHVHEIARGRIWTGEDALELGLVDALGGLDVALRLARESAGLDPDEHVRLRHYPTKRTTLALFFEQAERTETSTLTAGLQAVRAIQPFARVLRELGVYGEQLPLTTPDVASSF